MSVTVLLTAYNASKYISSTIESVLNQTYSNFEFIIIDGVNGFLCPVDDHNCLANNAITLLEDSNMYKSLSSSAEKTSSRYTPTEIGVQFLNY